MKFLFLIKSNVKNCRITSCQHPLLDSARIKSSFFVWKTERIPTSINAPATPDPQNLISLQLKVFSVREEMLSVTNQTVRTLQRDNSNKFDSQQSEGSGQASWHHMIISQNFPRNEMDFHKTNWHFKHVDAQNLQGQTKTTLRKTLYSVSVVARRQPPLQ